MTNVGNKTDSAAAVLQNGANDIKTALSGLTDSEARTNALLFLDTALLWAGQAFTADSIKHRIAQRAAAIKLESQAAAMRLREREEQLRAEDRADEVVDNSDWTKRDGAI